MKILLTNDDGAFAPGLRALRRELVKLGDVTTVAPATEQSAAGHSITLLTPLVVQELFDDQNKHLGWAVEGRPVDCVKLALQELMPEKPDVLISGMNAGANAGIDVIYSGTVGAAIEGAFYGLTSIAVSLDYTRDQPHDFATASAHARQVIEQILARQPRPGTLFNINIPPLEAGPIRGVRVVPQNVNPYSEPMVKRVDPRGRTYYWHCPPRSGPAHHPDTDVTLLEEGYITVTPLQFDLTDHRRLDELQSWKWTLDGASGV